ncbi:MULTISPECIES: hypothetical protein [unclassified Pseudomonas]|uniref:hypothetical protein n=1 Tax=unclassified Pseudomonas TaxID=196821 RepID=UPI00249B891A|nr:MULTISPECIES: hypothetical protein [unclassified Pseudomonas]MDI3249773.1 hypothetical protein [Pseudomonas sp. AL10]MDI3267137.1 hypothetical protein [Pseudomonas sp. AL15]
MGKGLYLVYFIVGLLLVKMSFDLYQSGVKILVDYDQCQRLEVPEKAECEQNVEGRSGIWSKVVLSVAGRI